jgi:hypothetical protein
MKSFIELIRGFAISLNKYADSLEWEDTLEKDLKIPIEKEVISTKENLCTVKQFCEMNNGKWPSEHALRALILNASWEQNEFQPAFKRMGRRVLIDPVKFWECVDKMQEKK